MLSSQLSEQMKVQISSDKYGIVENYINSLSYSSIITTMSASQQLSIDESLTKDILCTLVDIGVLQSSLTIRCPECRLLLESIDSIETTKNTFCIKCDTDVEIDSTDVEEIFFVLRNSNDVSEEFPDSYSLITVNNECEYGVSQGRLLHVADSIEELNNFAETNNFDDELLHYITGDNLA